MLFGVVCARCLLCVGRDVVFVVWYVVCCLSVVGLSLCGGVVCRLLCVVRCCPLRAVRCALFVGCCVLLFVVGRCVLIVLR